jgi:mannose-1-phosphate guanylyltransferase/mannose-6-phosphate isomerase
LVVTPANQTAQNPAAFQRALQQSIRAAVDDGIVILGITPDKPETSYGYIQQSGYAGANGNTPWPILQKPQPRSGQSLSRRWSAHLEQWHVCVARQHMAQSIAAFPS